LNTEAPMTITQIMPVVVTGSPKSLKKPRALKRPRAR